MSRIGADEQVKEYLRNWRWWIVLPALLVLWFVVRLTYVAEVSAERAGDWLWRFIWKEKSNG